MPASRKQLIVLLVVAAWVSLQLASAYSEASAKGFNLSPEELGRIVLGFFAYSMPVVLFGGVLFWWFGKRE